MERYLRDCVCGARDCVSLEFGLSSIFIWTMAKIPQIMTNFKSIVSSVFIWTVAKIPQIVTNFKSGSTEGLSLTFLNKLRFSP